MKSSTGTFRLHRNEDGNSYLASVHGFGISMNARGDKRERGHEEHINESGTKRTNSIREGKKQAIKFRNDL